MVNVFSFCLYGGSNPRYYVPLLENIKHIHQYFPSWQAWIYFAPDVDPAYVQVLQSYSNVVLHPTHTLGPANMILRFYAIDDPSVDLMFVRDADSLIHWKDRWAIHRFLEQPQYIAHTIRDHKDHTSKLMGGLWGLRRSAGLNIQEQYQAYLRNPIDMGIAHDQNFLSSYIYPQVLPHLLVHYSNGRTFANETAEAFPFEWSEEIYCGKIEMPTHSGLRFANGRFTTRVQ